MTYETKNTPEVRITQTVAILVDGNNVGMGAHEVFGRNMMINFDALVPKLLQGRGLSRMYYFREGASISDKLAKRLHEKFFGIVVPCGKSADMELAMTAIELSSKVDTIILCSGDKDYIPMVKRLKALGVRIEIAGIEGCVARELEDEVDFSYKISKDDCFLSKPPARVNSPR